MIWGGGRGNFRNEFIFPREPLPYKTFFPEKGLQIFRCPVSDSPQISCDARAYLGQADAHTDWTDFAHSITNAGGNDL